MEQNNNTEFIKGGLPLSSEDFVHPEKAQNNKSKLLVALDKINKVHSEKMSVAQAPEVEANVENTGFNPDIYSVSPVTKTDEYILDSEIERPVESVGEDWQTTDQSKEEPMFTTENFVEAPTSVEETPTEPAYDEINFENQSQEKPMFVVNDNEVALSSKKAKKAKSRKEKVLICSKEDTAKGRKFAWLAYIIFFIPLLIDRKNTFARFHANEGVEIFLMDIIGGAFLAVGLIVKNDNNWITLALMVATILGAIILSLSVLTRIALIVFSLAGKEASSPWFGRTQFIRIVK